MRSVWEYLYEAYDTNKFPPPPQNMLHEKMEIKLCYTSLIKHEGEHNAREKEPLRKQTQRTVQ